MLHLTPTQESIRKQLLLATQNKASNQIIYRSEWMGWLPFPVIGWVEFDGNDISKDFPSGWLNTDIVALERNGFLRKVKEWRNPDDEYECKITYEICG